MDDKWISWKDHPVPDDVKGINIKYADGIYGDAYVNGKRKIRQGHEILGWRFVERKKFSGVLA